MNDIILDPGFGFAKTLDHNYGLFSKMEALGFEGFPLLIGISRKSMIYNLFETTPQEALNGTSVLNMVALQKGAKILRVHDVREAKETLQIFQNQPFLHRMLQYYLKHFYYLILKYLMLF